MKMFHPVLYEKLFGQWTDSVMLAHEKDEIDVIRGIRKVYLRDMVDVGAGYGRIIPYVIPISKRLFCIDIDKNMYLSLRDKTCKYTNLFAIKGDITKLSKVMNKIVLEKPILLLLQNTLGTIKGEWIDVLTEMKKIAKLNNGEIIISLYRQQALEKWGLMTYEHGIEMNGEPDLERTDLNRGLFISKTGYLSKWWTDKDIEYIKKYLGGKVVNEKSAFEYSVIHIAY